MGQQLQKQEETSSTTTVSAAPADTAVIPVEPADPSEARLPESAGESSEKAATERRKNEGRFSGSDKRKNVVDRRMGLERRVIDIGSPTGLERRRGPGRRRSDDRKSAEEGEMSNEQFEFVMAVDTYKRLNNRPFPTWTEVLEVVKQLGYRKVAQSTIKLPNANGR